MAKPIALAADHGGFELKEAVKAHLEELGLEYMTGLGETNLIGVANTAEYGRVSGETHVLHGLTLWAEYLDAIAVVTFGEGT